MIPRYHFSELYADLLPVNTWKFSFIICIFAYQRYKLSLLSELDTMYLQNEVIGMHGHDGFNGHIAGAERLPLPEENKERMK